MSTGYCSFYSCGGYLLIIRLLVDGYTEVCEISFRLCLFFIFFLLIYLLLFFLFFYLVRKSFNHRWTWHGNKTTVLYKIISLFQLDRKGKFFYMLWKYVRRRKSGICFEKTNACRPALTKYWVTQVSCIIIYIREIEIIKENMKELLEQTNMLVSLKVIVKFNNPVGEW